MHQISEVESHKHLGLYFSYDCNWHQHIEYITDKAWNFRLDRKSLETIYTALSHLGIFVTTGCSSRRQYVIAVRLDILDLCGMSRVCLFAGGWTQLSHIFLNDAVFKLSSIH